jgi:hypothetical protein
MLKNCEELECKMVLPFAGAYVLGGALAKKNHYLGTTTWDVCANYLKKHLKNDTEVICLRENDEIDLISRNRNNTYIPIDHNEMEIYINEKLSKVKYDYELEPVVNYSALKKDLILASKKMSERCKKILLIPDMDVEIEIDGKKINICKVDESKGLLSCSLDPRLLRKILDRALSSIFLNSLGSNEQLNKPLDSSTLQIFIFLPSISISTSISGMSNIFLHRSDIFFEAKIKSFFRAL